MMSSLAVLLNIIGKVYLTSVGSWKITVRSRYFFLFQLRFLIENERNTAVRIQSGDFSLDTMELKYSSEFYIILYKYHLKVSCWWKAS